MASWREVMPTFTEELCTHLGLGWQPTGEVSDWQAWAEGPDGQRLMLCTRDSREHPTKLEVHTCYPPGGRGPDEKIGCSLSRGPEAVAKDVARRLLPGYPERLAEAWARIHQQAAGERAQEEAVAELSGIVPGSQPWNHEPKFSIDLPKGWADVTVGFPGTEGSLSMKYVPADLIRQVLHTVAAWKAANTKETVDA